MLLLCFFFFSSRRRHTRWPRDWSSDVCSSDLRPGEGADHRAHAEPMEARTEQVRAMRRAVEPPAHKLGGGALRPDAPGEVLAGERAPNAEARHPAGEVAVREDAGAHHVRRPRPRRNPERPVGAERGEPVLGTRSIHLLNHGQLGALDCAIRGGRDRHGGECDGKYEKTEDGSAHPGNHRCTCLVGQPPFGGYGCTPLRASGGRRGAQVSITSRATLSKQCWQQVPQSVWQDSTGTSNPLERKTWYCPPLGEGSSLDPR